MTLEEISIKISDHLTKQRARSIVPSPFEGDDGQCSYRGEDGRMCAVGCLIDDKHYYKDMEGNAATSDRVFSAVKASLGCGVINGLPFLLSRWQAYHDRRAVHNFGKDYSYSRWIEGDEGSSPAAFHGALMEYLK